MRDINAARERLITLFTDVGRDLVQGVVGGSEGMPAAVVDHMRDGIRVHLSGRADHDILAMSLLSEEALRDMVRSVLEEPFRHMAAALAHTHRTIVRNGMGN